MCYTVEKINNSKYSIVKDGTPSYTVEKKQTNWHCSCTGFKYRGTCKHLALVEGVLPKRYSREIITEAIKGILPKLREITDRVEVVGSYRRLSKDSKDIDFLMDCSASDFAKVNDILKSFSGYEPVVSGDTIIRGYINIAGERIEMDINRLSEKMNYSLALLYRTGPANFNIATRALAKKLGGKLSENEFVLYGRSIPVSSEKDVFDALGIVYQAPENRSEYLRFK